MEEEEKPISNREVVGAGLSSLFLVSSQESPLYRLKEEMEEAKRVLMENTVKQLVGSKGRLVEVPYSASVGDTLRALQAHNVVSVPVAAPPGHWIGAGGSMILESDKNTGAARKHYIGIVSALDILIHLAESQPSQDPLVLLASPVSKVIGHCLEGLTLWSISPHTSVLEALEPLGKGIHRALVPLESQMDHAKGLESIEASPGYRILTQTDLIHFLRAESQSLHPILSKSVQCLGVVQSSIFGVPEDMTLVDTMRCMTQASLTAVAILAVEADNEPVQQLISGKGKKIVGTFSASDLRGCSAEAFTKWGPVGVLKFLMRDQVSAMEQVTCFMSSTLKEVISKALDRKVHRVWVVQEGSDDILQGLISFSDILKVVRHECTSA